MKQILVTLNVDEEAIQNASGCDCLEDAVSQELGWLHDSGMFVENWCFVNSEKGQRREALPAELLEDKSAFLEDFFWKQKITMDVWAEGGHLVAEDDEGNRWVDEEIYDFAVNECLCFNPDGSLSDGLAAAEPFAERLVKDAKEFGVEITSYVRSVDSLIGEACDRSSLPETKPMDNDELTIEGV